MTEEDLWNFLRNEVPMDIKKTYYLKGNVIKYYYTNKDVNHMLEIKLIRDTTKEELSKTLEILYD